ncbi:hypothetical protein AeMF1_017794 [Aphanomyces euteiches]|nr:hypothetical protein AeMF1_017794 [Aphanomyces euteiches]KAH9196016.1 hypothetical protein AeNC1_002000 [Aphanomyces euteiches]
MAIHRFFVFAILFVVSQVSVVRGAWQPPLLPQALSSLIESSKPLLTTLTKTTALIPATVGNCAATDNPPKPCTEIGNLFSTTSYIYKIDARWISGLNTFSIDNLALTPDATGKIKLDVAVTFKSLPISLNVEGCLPSVGCHKVVDDTTTCCGANKTIELSIAASCSETFPYLGNFSVTKAKIMPSLDITLNLMGKLTKVLDATSIVESQLKTQGTNLLAAQGAPAINDLLKTLYGDQIYCTADSQKKGVQPPVSAVQQLAASSATAPLVSLLVLIIALAWM